jgi:hypothetical protein
MTGFVLQLIGMRDLSPAFWKARLEVQGVGSERRARVKDCSRPTAVGASSIGLLHGHPPLTTLAPRPRQHPAVGTVGLSR